MQSSDSTVGQKTVESDNSEECRKVYKGYIPIGQIEIDGQIYNVHQPFTFEQMQIKLKDQE